MGKQIGYAILTGFGVGQTLQPSLIAVQAGVERKHMAIVTSVRNFIRNLGSTLGLAISGTLINNAVRTTLTPFGLTSSDIQLLLNSPDRFRVQFGDDRTVAIRTELRSAYQNGFRIIFYVMSSLAALAFFAAWFLIPHVELIRADDAKLKEEGKRRAAEKGNAGD